MVSFVDCLGQDLQHLAFYELYRSMGDNRPSVDSARLSRRLHLLCRSSPYRAQGLREGYKLYTAHCLTYIRTFDKSLVEPSDKQLLETKEETVADAALAE